MTIKPSGRRILALILLFVASSAAGSNLQTWRSPDGAISLTLHDEWQRGGNSSSKPYDSRSSSLVFPDSIYRLHMGGIFYRRYAAVQVAHLANARGTSASQFVDLLVTRLQGQGLEIQRRYWDGIRKGFIQYRFMHSGDPVSQVAIIVEAETGIFFIEVTAPREDEERLHGEALQLLNSVSVLRPAR